MLEQGLQQGTEVENIGRAWRVLCLTSRIWSFYCVWWESLGSFEHRADLISFGYTWLCVECEFMGRKIRYKESVKQVQRFWCKRKGLIQCVPVRIQDHEWILETHRGYNEWALVTKWFGDVGSRRNRKVYNVLFWWMSANSLYIYIYKYLYINIYIYI